MLLCCATRVWSLWVVWFACVQLPAALVSAEHSDEQQLDARQPNGYREAIDGAVKEFGAQNYAEARSLFMRAHALYPNARTHRGIGVAQFELRQYVECVRHLEAALASAVKPLSAELRTETERLLTRANEFVGRIELSTKPEGARALVDGAEIARQAPLRLLLGLGEHTLEVAAPGFVTEQRRLSVVGGERTKLTILLAASSAPAAAATRAERRWYKSPWLWLGLGVVVAGAAAGTGYALTREDEVTPSYGGSVNMVLKGP